MWIRRSDILAPLTKLTSSKEDWVWTDLEQKAFDRIRHVVSKETLLAYPDFEKPFMIHTDASYTQLGAVNSKNNKPIAFYGKQQYFSSFNQLSALYQGSFEIQKLKDKHLGFMKVSIWIPS